MAASVRRRCLAPPSPFSHPLSPNNKSSRTHNNTHTFNTLNQPSINQHTPTPTPTPTHSVKLFEPENDRVVQRVPGFYSVGGVRPSNNAAAPPL